MRLVIRPLLFLSLIIFISACKPVPVSHWFPVTPQEFYEKELYKAKMEKTESGQTWFRVGRDVLSDTLQTNLPHQERFFLGDSMPAQAIRLKMPLGRKLVIRPSRNENDSTARLFVELYRIKPNGKPQRIDYLKEQSGELTYVGTEDDTLLLRLQTGLNEKLAVSVSFATQPVLSFPVAGHDMSDVISFWGAERDRGVRSHEGIDIKAKRGTPVVASANGFISSSGTNDLGGKIVFLSAADSPYSIYYAHLDSQLVSSGTRVVRGDTLGLVGNTGNAITTTPHLHYGIYGRDGALNPLPFIDNRKEKITELPAISRWLGDSARIRKKTVLYASSQLDRQREIQPIAQNTVLRIIGEMAKGYRVSMPDGTQGYISKVPLERITQDISAKKAEKRGLQAEEKGL